MRGKNENIQNDFNGYTYENTLACFKFTMKNPNDVRNGETRGEWFVRVHGITGKEFMKITQNEWLN